MSTFATCGEQEPSTRDETKTIPVQCRETRSLRNDTCRRSRRTVNPLAERLRASEIHDSRIAAEFTGTQENRRLLESMQIPGARDDLSAGQCSIEGALEAGAYQEPFARSLGIEPRSRIHLHPPEPADQET